MWQQVLVRAGCNTFFPNEVRKNGTKYIIVLTIGKLTLVTNTSNVASSNNFEVGKNISIFFLNSSQLFIDLTRHS